MGLTNEHVEPKILAKIKIYVLTRAELLFTLCYEIPCTLKMNKCQLVHLLKKNKIKIIYLRTIQTYRQALIHILEFVCIMDNIKTDDLRIKIMYSFKICTKTWKYIIVQLENMKKFCNVFARMLLLTLSRFGCNSIKALTKGTRILG